MYFVITLLTFYSTLILCAASGTTRSSSINTHGNGLKFLKSTLNFRKFIVTGSLSCSIICSNYNLFPFIFPRSSTNQLMSISLADEYKLDSEAIALILKARQIENNSIDSKLAQTLYEQVVVAYPDYAVGWSDLGNVLTSRGFLNQALLCYKKSLSLKPPRESTGIILLNKAALEQALGNYDEALNDLASAEKLVDFDTSGTNIKFSITTNKAVILSNKGEWQESCKLFDTVINRGEKNALPWWLRYSMSLLEVNRSTESLAFLQRTLNRFPSETECKAFAAALYTSMGNPNEGLQYWNKIPDIEKESYLKTNNDPSFFVKEKLKWGPVSVANYVKFIQYLNNI